MSVLIKGMEMPKNCLECMFRISYWKRALTPSGKIFTYGCMLNGKEINMLEKRCKDCPLVEVPTPHGDLVDRDDLTDEINRVTFAERYDYNVAYNIVTDADTIIEAEVEE